MSFTVVILVLCAAFGVFMYCDHWEKKKKKVFF
jgi:hypothetical protein